MWVRFTRRSPNRELRAIDTFIKVRGGEAKVITEDALNEILREARIPSVTAEATREYIEAWVERTKGWVWVHSRFAVWFFRFMRMFVGMFRRLQIFVS